MEQKANAGAIPWCCISSNRTKNKIKRIGSLHEKAPIEAVNTPTSPTAQGYTRTTFKKTETAAPVVASIKGCVAQRCCKLCDERKDSRRKPQLLLDAYYRHSVFIGKLALK